jgi:hypothetical protein
VLVLLGKRSLLRGGACKSDELACPTKLHEIRSAFVGKEPTSIPGGGPGIRSAFGTRIAIKKAAKNKVKYANNTHLIT